MAKDSYRNPELQKSPGTLKSCVKGGPDAPDKVAETLSKVIEELEISLEELFAADEELFLQNESQWMLRVVPHLDRFHLRLGDLARPRWELYLYSPSCEHITGYLADEFLRDQELRGKIVHTDDRELFPRHLQKSDQEIFPVNLKHPVHS